MSIIGLHADPALVREEVEDNVLTGARTIQVFEVVSRAAADAKKMEVAAAGATTIVRRSKGDGNWEVIGTWQYDPGQGEPTLEPPQSVHELELNIATPETLTNPLILSRFVVKYGAVTTANKKLGSIGKIVTEFERGDYGKGEEAATKAEAKVDSTCPGFPTAKELFQGMAYRKFTNYISYDPVYRRTLTAASPLQVQASFEGAGKIWTSHEVELFEVLPNSWWFSLPSTHQWLKSPPHVQTVAGQKTQITYSYTGKLSWWVLDYEPYQSAVLFGADRI